MRTMSGLHRALAALAPGVALAASCTGCILNGARVEVAAEQARFPISMTAVLPDATGKNLRVGHELVTRGRLAGEATACSFLYGATPATVEISALVNEQVRAAAGEGVASLVIEAGNGGWGWVFPLALLPFWPSCLNLRVSGLIVARRPVQSVAAPPPSEPTPPPSPASSAPVPSPERP